MRDENLGLFLERFRDFNIEIEARKKRGQNDFNPLLCVQKLDDEENMHSGFLYALLNPYGEHYQDDLFLKLFLKSVGLKEWFGNTSNARVYKEKKRIDIYIANGEKHIIVENKIWAGDQDRQIERYIETMAKERSLDSNDDMESNELESSEKETKQEQSKSYKNIAVLYLTPDSKNPTPQSLGKWQIQGEYLIDSKNNQVRFKAISYEKEILKWLESAFNEAGGISNLRMAIECYADVVKRLIGKKDNAMDLRAFFNKEENRQFLDIALELVARRDELAKIQFLITAQAIKKIIDDKYKEYRYKIIFEKPHMRVLNKEFYEKKMSFDIYAEYGTRTALVWFGVALDGYDRKRTQAVIDTLKSVLDIDNSAFHIYTIQTAQNPKKYHRIHIGENPNCKPKDFTQEKFINFFESVRKQADKFNQKIADDLAKSDSKLRKFLIDND